jgi:hypothetical protein
MVVSETEFALLQQRVDAHIKECDEEHRFTAVALQAGREQFSAITMQQAEMNTKLDTLVTNTADLIKYDRNLKGAAATGMALSKFLAWLVGLGAAGAALAASISHLLDTIKEVFGK